MDSENGSKNLSHFLENKNFPASRKNGKKSKHRIPEQEPLDSLAVVNGEIVINNPVQERSRWVEDRVTSFSYTRRSSKRSRWTQAETAIFYKALSLCGTDFSLLENIFTDRERRQLKNKFSREEREHPEKVNQALGRKHRFTKTDLEELKSAYTEIKNAD